MHTFIMTPYVWKSGVMQLKILVFAYAAIALLIRELTIIIDQANDNFNCCILWQASLYIIYTS